MSKIDVVIHRFDGHDDDEIGNAGAADVGSCMELRPSS